MSIQHINTISNRLSLRLPAARFAGDSGLRVRDGLTLPVCVRARTGRDGRRSAAMERNEHVTRFLHIGDWQLGMTRHFFSEGVQERFAQSRFDAIRELGRIAEEEDCFRARDLQDSGNELEICLPSLKDSIKKHQDAAFGMDFPFGLPGVLVEQEIWKEFIITFPRIALV